MRSAIPFAALLAATVVSGCIVSSTPAAVSDAVKFEVLSYSNAIFDTIITGFNSGNYSMFSAGFSRNLAELMDRNKFEDLRLRILASVGKYASRDREAEVMETGGYYSVTYTAQFTDESPVYIIMVFKKGSFLLEDIRFTSKKLIGKL